MTEADKRLATAVAAWCKAEIENGMLVHSVQSKTACTVTQGKDGKREFPHIAFCCSGFKEPSHQFTGWQASIENCGRHLVAEILAHRDEKHVSGGWESLSEGKSHRIVWRDFPEIFECVYGGQAILPKMNAYCRFSYVPVDAGEIVDEG